MPDFETPELARAFALVSEGSCPHDHGPLRRDRDCGWCETCKAGWSIVGKECRIHADLNRGTEITWGEQGWRWYPPLVN